jgi:hypothetical protein
MTRPARVFPSELLLAIEEEFADRVPKLFGASLGFAFIFGGFGKGYGGWGHDVDMFVCVTKACDGQARAFHEWYFDLHERTGLPPDIIYPGEIVEIDDLHRRIQLLESRTIRPVIETQYEYEAILWVDALIESKKAFTQGPAVDEGLVNAMLGQAAALNKKWRARMLDIRPETAAEQDKLDLRRLFKGHVAYLKQAGI